MDVESLARLESAGKYIGLENAGMAFRFLKEQTQIMCIEGKVPVANTRKKAFPACGCVERGA